MPELQAATSLADKIQADIFYGRLAPGMWLKQIELERHYECTRLALRQALDAVSSKGMLRHEPNRGYHVEFFDEERVVANAEARAVLEIASAEMVLDHVSPAFLRELTRLAGRHSELVETGTLLEHEQANRAFHQALHAPCRNRVIGELIFDLRNRVPLAITRATNTPMHLRARTAEHFELIDALRTRDVPALREIFWRHIVPARSTPRP